MGRIRITPVVTDGKFVIEDFLEEATQDYLRGAPLNDEDRDGYVAEGSANPTDIYGFAMKDGGNGTAAGDKKAKIALALDGCVFRGTLDRASTLGTYALVQSDIGAEFGLTEDSVGVWYLDFDKKDGANSRVRVIRALDPIGTNQPKVLFVVSGEHAEFHDT